MVTLTIRRQLEKERVRDRKLLLLRMEIREKCTIVLSISQLLIDKQLFICVHDLHLKLMFEIVSVAISASRA